MAYDTISRKIYGLKSRPFADFRARRETLNLWVDRQPEVAEWQNQLGLIGGSNSNYIGFIIGDYGSGKSLGLYKIEELALQHFRKIFPIIFSMRGEERVREPGTDIIKRIFRFINFGNIKIKKKQLESFGEALAEPSSIFEKILFGKSADRNLAHHFLTGDIRPTRAQLKELGIMRKIDNIDIAKEYLLGLLYLLRVSGYDSLLVLIDEFEYIFSLVSKSYQNIYLAALRGLFDMNLDTDYGSAANVAIFIAASADAWTRLQDLEKAEKATGGPINPLLRRTSSKTILKDFSKKESRELITKNLRYNRDNRTIQRDPLIPFSEDFVDYVCKLTKGTPGLIVSMCAHVLDSGIKHGAKQLTAEFAKRTLEEKALVY